MADITPKKELTEAEKAAQALREQTTPEELKRKQVESDRIAREQAAQKELMETRNETRQAVENIKTDIAPEQIQDAHMLDQILTLKIKEVPKSVPAYLDLIVEKNPLILETAGVSTMLAQRMQEFLLVVASKPELSRDRDWMDSLRKSLNHIVISPVMAKKLFEYGVMDSALREQLQKELGIDAKITEWLDANTRDIVEKVHTGFYRFDAEVNTWVNSVGALVFLWPENIAGIKKYLAATKPDHPFLSVTNYHSSDVAGKYGVISDGRPHNMMLAEADYLTQYMKLRGEGKDDTAVFDELWRTHVAHLKDNKAVQDAVSAFEKKYGEGIFNASPDSQLFAQSEKISETVLPQEISDYYEIKKFINGKREKYDAVLEKRPEMETLIYDIAGGFIRFDVGDHTFKTVTGQKLRFTEQELSLIKEVFTDTRPTAPFLRDTQILIYTTTDRRHDQYDTDTLRQRINYYQQ